MTVEEEEVATRLPSAFPAAGTRVAIDGTEWLKVDTARESQFPVGVRNHARNDTKF